MDKDAVKFWQGVLRDTVVLVVAAWILVHETLEDSSPSPLLIGAAITLIGVPAAARVDIRRRENGSNGSPQ